MTKKKFIGGAAKTVVPGRVFVTQDKDSITVRASVS